MKTVYIQLDKNADSVEIMSSILGSSSTETYSSIIEKKNYKSKFYRNKNNILCGWNIDLNESICNINKTWSEKFICSNYNAIYSGMLDSAHINFG